MVFCVIWKIVFMKRILHCFNGLDNGWVEAFVKNVYRNIDRDN